ncbi:MAG TPA: hypothetical protein PLJ21_07920 [Pseudobdellovibrionaceae bacterium]|nr:hypothetical protein [Pseudobdellovibrionaceae bacterium]
MTHGGSCKIVVNFQRIAFFVVFLLFQSALAANFFTFKDSYFLFGYHQFSAESLSGFTEGTTGYGGTLGKDIKTWGRLTFFGELGGYFIQGQEVFLDGVTAQRTLEHNGLVSGLHLGSRFRIIGSDKGSQIYLGIIGVADFIYIKLPLDIDYTALNQTDNAFMLGPQIELGFKIKRSRWSFIFAGRYSDLKVDIFNKPTYNIKGPSYHMGIQF